MALSGLLRADVPLRTYTFTLYISLSPSGITHCTLDLSCLLVWIPVRPNDSVQYNYCACFDINCSDRQ